MNEETKIKNDCHKFLKKNNIFHFKLSDKFYSGIPDILIIWHGDAIWVELKTPSGNLSEIQKWTISELQKNDCMVYVLTSLEELKEVLRGLHVYKD